MFQCCCIVVANIDQQRGVYKRIGDCKEGIAVPLPQNGMLNLLILGNPSNRCLLNHSLTTICSRKDKVDQSSQLRCCISVDCVAQGKSGSCTTQENCPDQITLLPESDSLEQNQFITTFVALDFGHSDSTSYLLMSCRDPTCHAFRDCGCCLTTIQLNFDGVLQGHSGLTPLSISSLSATPAPPSFGLQEISYLPETSTGQNDDASPFDQW